MALSEQNVAQLRESIYEDRVTLLSDIVNISQTPAPTFDETERGRLMEGRFKELGVDNVYRDPEGNVVAHVKQHDVPAVCVTAHLDTVFARSVNHTVLVDDRHVRGPSVGDDSLGLASLLSILRLLDRDELGHLILVATTGTEGEGNLKGSRYFVENCRADIDFALCLEGHGLGRIDHWSLGTRRFQIRAESDGGHVWRDQTGENPIESFGDLISQLREVHREFRDQDPVGLVNLGMIRGGSAFNTVPYECELDVELRSPDSDVLVQLIDRVFDAVQQTNTQTEVDYSLKEVSRRPASSIPADHWLVNCLESIHERLDLPAEKGPASSDSCVFLDAGIPTLTLGLARGRNKHRQNEEIDIESLETGQLQLMMGLIEATRQSRETGATTPSAV